MIQLVTIEYEMNCDNNVIGEEPVNALFLAPIIECVLLKPIFFQLKMKRKKRVILNMAGVAFRW